MLTSRDWHNRFCQQAAWTASVRTYILDTLHLQPEHTLLEVGCGTGAVLVDLDAQTSMQFGLDRSRSHLNLARQHLPAARLIQGDALRLPLAANTIDITVCHFLLMWLKAPLTALREMARVTKPGGWVIAFAEPDYGGRIDFPPPLEHLAALQAESLHRQGANPLTGRRLASWFHRIGLQQVHTGLLGGQWASPPSQLEWENEWKMIASDLKDLVSQADLQKWKRQDKDAWQSGERVLFVPTFYAWGRVP